MRQQARTGALGAQHMRMLQPTQARMPPIALMMPGMPAPKPIIEKMQKTKGAITKHLALLASLGISGLGEHMACQEREGEWVGAEGVE